MLSVNRIFILLFIGIFSSSLYAIDVSNFDIKGIKLGDSYESVKKTLSVCKITKEYRSKTNDKKLIFQIEIGFKCENDSFFTAYFNRKKELMDFQRLVMIESKPNLHQIKTKIIKKYGKPIGKSKFYNPNANSSKQYSSETLCWGTNYDCKVYTHPNLKGTLITDTASRKNKSFTFTITGPSDSYGYDLWFNLWDIKSVRENEKWSTQRNKTFNLDL